MTHTHHDFPHILHTRPLKCIHVSNSNKNYTSSKSDVFTVLRHIHTLSCIVSLRYAASIDDILEEEEHYADQLKEYLFYTDAVR